MYMLGYILWSMFFKTHRCACLD